jgi:hypothetical protein
MRFCDALDIAAEEVRVTLVALGSVEAGPRSATVQLVSRRKPWRVGETRQVRLSKVKRPLWFRPTRPGVGARMGTPNLVGFPATVASSTGSRIGYGHSQSSRWSGSGYLASQPGDSAICAYFVYLS